MCTYNGTEIFRAELHPAIAANPFFAFSTVATESGTLAFHWTGDNGFSVTESAAIVVAELRLAVAPRRSRTRACVVARLDRRSRPSRLGRFASRRASAFAGEIPPAERRSGYDFMSRETRAMQDDDTANPGLLWVLEGGALWSRKTGAAGRACADCHGDARDEHEGRGRAPSGVRRRHGPADQSRAAHQPVPHRSAAGAARSPGRAASCWR